MSSYNGIRSILRVKCLKTSLKSNGPIVWIGPFDLGVHKEVFIPKSNKHIQSSFY